MAGAAAPARKRGRPSVAPSNAGGTRKAILDAALKVFARDGFDGASLPRIAELAGVAHPLIHYHFGTKDELWRQMVEHAFGGLAAEAEAVEAASRALPALDRLRVLIHSFTRFAARYPDNFSLSMMEARSGSERLAWLRENYTGAFFTRLSDVLREAQAEGKIRPVPVENLTFMLIGSVLLYFSFNYTLPEGDPDALAEAHARQVLDTFLNGIAV